MEIIARELAEGMNTTEWGYIGEVVHFTGRNWLGDEWRERVAFDIQRGEVELYADEYVRIRP